MTEFCFEIHTLFIYSFSELFNGCFFCTKMLCYFLKKVGVTCFHGGDSTSHTNTYMWLPILTGNSLWTNGLKCHLPVWPPLMDITWEEMSDRASALWPQAIFSVNGYGKGQGHVSQGGLCLAIRVSGTCEPGKLSLRAMEHAALQDLRTFPGAACSADQSKCFPKESCRGGGKALLLKSENSWI